MGPANLKKKTVILLAKVGLLQSGTCKLWQYPQTRLTDKGEEHYFVEREEDTGRGCVKESVLEESGSG